jgi:hypothetical protein
MMREKVTFDQMIMIAKIYFIVHSNNWRAVMVFNATLNNISVISWKSILLVDETGVPREKSLTNFITPRQERETNG